MIRAQLFEQPSFVMPFDEAQQLRGQRVGVTGARGMLGRILVNRLLRLGVSVNKFEGDVRHIDQVDSWTGSQGFDLVFHLAAVVPVQAVLAEPLRAFETNALGPALVAASVFTSNPDCWFFAASTSHVYKAYPTSSPLAITEDSEPSPTTFYGVTKLLGEQTLVPLTEELGFAICTARIFSYSHATQQPPFLVPSLRDQIMLLGDDEVLRVTNATAVRDILDAETVVDCVLHLASRRHVGLLNIGSGKGKSIACIARRVAEDLGTSVGIESAGEETANSVIADVGRLRTVLERPNGS